jgi:protein SCO1
MIGYLFLLLLANKAIAAENWSLSKAALADIEIVDQTNKPLKFYDDLIKNQTVAINFVFTTCTSSCPLSTAIFRQVQKKLGKQKVQLITISVDPTTDTPERLLAFSNKHNAAPGWAFITGDKMAIATLLKTLGVYSADKNDHSNLVIVGNDATHNWSRLYGFPQVDEILSALHNVSDKSKSK